MKYLPVTKFLVLTLCVLCYYQSLDGDFTFDDQVRRTEWNQLTIPLIDNHLLKQVAIVKNRDVTDRSTSYIRIFSNDFWGSNITDPTSHKSYRPLTILSFHWEHKLFGLNAFYMKITNFLLHCLVCVLLIHVLPILLPNIDQIWLNRATVIFAVHPIHCEVDILISRRDIKNIKFDLTIQQVVCGVVGRSELMCSIFWIIGVWIMMKGLQRGLCRVVGSFSILN